MKDGVGDGSWMSCGNFWCSSQLVPGVNSGESVVSSECSYVVVVSSAAGLLLVLMFEYHLDLFYVVSWPESDGGEVMRLPVNCFKFELGAMLEHSLQALEALWSRRWSLSVSCGVFGPNGIEDFLRIPKGTWRIFFIYFSAAFSLGRQLGLPLL